MKIGVSERRLLKARRPAQLRAARSGINVTEQVLLEKELPADVS